MPCLAHALQARPSSTTGARRARSDLHNNSLTGSLPAAWSALSLLEHLDLSYNGLSGSLPPSYGSLGALQYLDASHNRLGGTLPAAWSGMALLEVGRVQGQWMAWRKDRSRRTCCMAAATGAWARSAVAK